jgi:CRISPR-associated protein Cas2
VRSHGDRLQYSVFLCELDTIEKLGMMSELRLVIDHRHDSIVVIDLGEPGRHNSARIETMGTSRRLPDSGPTIV